MTAEKRQSLPLCINRVSLRFVGALNALIFGSSRFGIILLAM
jgi:hypothetical protein